MPPRSPDRWPRPPASWRSISPAPGGNFTCRCGSGAVASSRGFWQALQQIPYGQTRSYGQIAEANRRPKGRPGGGPGLQTAIRC